MMKYRTKIVKNISSLIQNLKIHTSDLNQPIWYRGHAKQDWLLESRLIRENLATSERDYINKFKQNATLILSDEIRHNLNNSEFEWLFLMQHNGFPTRLLDWTENPLVGLYFVIRKRQYFSHDGTLWVLLPTKLNEISNLGYGPNIIPSFEEQLIQDCTPERIAQTGGQNNPVAAIAPRNNRRMQAQLGVFTISPANNRRIDTIGNGDHIWKYTIPADYKEEIANEFKLLAINEFTLFPEIDKI